MKRTEFLLAFIFFFIIGIHPGTRAIAEDLTTGYSGDFLSRSTMTGDWGGVRNDLAKRGVTFDMNLTQIWQGVTDGGKETDWEYGGRGNLTINADTQKLGLWPGGFLTVEVEGNFDEDVNFNSGAIIPVNTDHLFPMPGDRELNISAVTFTQFLSKYFGVVLGKMDTTFADANEFAHGKGDKQFMNTAFNVTPAGSLIITNSTLGAGVIILPTKDPEAAVITAIVVDSNGKANRSGFDTAFEGNNTYAVEGRVRTDFFGLPGHQLVGAAYSNKEFNSLDQNLRLILENRGISEEDGSWLVYYNFDQYLYQPQKDRGLGIFGRFAVTDGQANPIHYFYSIGVGGKGIIPGRPLDESGIGYYYINISHPRFTGPFVTREFLRDEWGVEAYYNIALTPWLKLTPDIQVIRPAQKDIINIEAGMPPSISREGIKNATVLGLRLQLIF
jgi:porin